MVKMDSLDEQLIGLLLEQKHRSSEALAEQLGVSPVTARRRMKKLIQSGVLLMGALVDPMKLGFRVIVVISFNILPGKSELIQEMLTCKPEIVSIFMTTGRFDIIAVARFRSTDELSDFVQKDLATVEGIISTETAIVLKVTKGNYIRIYLD